MGGTQHTIPSDLDGRRLDAALAALAGCGIRAAKRMALDGRVLVDGRPRPPHFRVKAAMSVTLLGSEPAGPGDQPQVIAVRDDYVFLNKPAGLHTAHLHGGTGESLESLLAVQWRAVALSGTALRVPSWPQRLREALRMAGPEALSLVEPSWSDGQPGPGHASYPLPLSAPALLTRLDFATSGIVAAAASPAAAEDYRRMEREGWVRKHYLAVVRGRLDQSLDLARALKVDSRRKTGLLAHDDPDPVRHTRVVALGRASDYLPSMAGMDATLVLARIRRGARHQIRAHLAGAGFPLVGDPLYGPEDADYNIYLHHARLDLPDFSVALPPPWEFYP